MLSLHQQTKQNTQMNNFQNNDNHPLNNKFSEVWIKQHMERKRKGRMIAGLLLALGGALYLAKVLGAPLSPFIFTPGVLVMAIGFYIFAKNGFSRPGGLITMAVGAALLLHKIYPGVNIMQYAVPVIVIIAGLSMVAFGYIFNSKKKGDACMNKNNMWSSKSADFTNENRLNERTIMGGINKTVISKNLEGGEISAIMGGVELNLMQADIQSKVVLNLNVIMGGVTIIVPSNWVIINEVTTILGGAEDQRASAGIQFDQSKILVLSGNLIMGGLEIKSY